MPPRAFHEDTAPRSPRASKSGNEAAGRQKDEDGAQTAAAMPTTASDSTTQHAVAKEDMTTETAKESDVAAEQSKTDDVADADRQALEAQVESLAITDAPPEEPTPDQPKAAGQASQKSSSAGDRLEPGQTVQRSTSPAASQEDWDEKQEDETLEGAAQGEQFLNEDDTERTATSEKRESRPEIQGIMDQFEEDKVVEPSALKQTPTGGSIASTLPIFQYPPRSSSLAESENAVVGAAASSASSPEAVASPPTAATSGGSAFSGQSHRTSMSVSQPTVSQPPPPAPDPEPDLPFDFHRFLEQLRHRTADPVAKFLRSFLQEFAKKPWMVHEQQKIITDFLTFISNRMAQCEVWKNVSDAEFDNAREGMEKLVMNRLYTQTFSPEIPPVDAARTAGRRRPQDPSYMPGRRGQHQEDTERDEVLAQKIRIYGWVKEEHLDLKSFSDKGRKFLVLAQQELLKINSYRAPRDKVICVLNSCKVLFGFLRNSSNDTSADSFIPLLIYTVLKAAPGHLVSNLQYIIRFRNPDKLNGEAGYYMSSLMGAVQFIENLDRTSLTISDVDFEKEVEMSVSAMAERHEKEERRKSADRLRLAADKSGPSRPQVTAHNSQERQRQGDGEENAAVAGLLRSIQKPLSTLGRFLTEESSPPSSSHGERSTMSTAQAISTPRQSPLPAPRRGLMGAVAGSGVVAPPIPLHPSAGADQRGQRLAAQDAAALHASAGSAEAHRKQRAEHQTVVE